MISSLFLGALLVLGSCAVAAPTSPLHNTTHTCGSTPSPEEVAAAQAHFLQHKVTPQPNPALSAPIPVYFHVIYDNPSCVSASFTPIQFLTVMFFDYFFADGNVPDAQIIAQMGVLNANFAPTGRSFILGGVTRTYNPSWFNFAGPGTVFQTAMKSTLHIGGAASLNIYTVGFVNIAQPGLLGYATFPWQYAAAPLDDGVVLHYATLPGGAAALNNLGRVGTHEVGRKHLQFFFGSSVIKWQC